MPISDVTVVAQILFAETQDFVDDPNAPAGLGLDRLRAVLALMISRSDSGYGYAAALVPDTGVLGSKTRFPIWQACIAAAEQPTAPAQVSGRDPDVAFLSDQDPTTDANLLKAFPWLAAKPTFSVEGVATRRGAPVKLFVSAGTNAPRTGRFPGDDVSGATAKKSLQAGFGNRFWGTLAFLMVVGALFASAYWAMPSVKQLQQPTLDQLTAARSTAMQHLSAAQAAASAPSAASESIATLTRAQAAAANAQTTVQNFSPLQLLPQWGLAAFAVFSLFAITSFGLNGQLLGFLVDDRGRMSLARLQLVAWTILILSAYWIASAWNIGVLGVDVSAKAHEILPTMQRDLWLLLGIVVASPLASSLILDSKAQPSVTPSVSPSSTQPMQVTNADVVTNKGSVDMRTDQGSWSFLDLFAGEFVGNRACVDVSRVQQFIFTLLALSAYASLVWGGFGSVKPAMIDSMPVLGENAVALLGLSHVAYLAAKGIQK